MWRPKWSMGPQSLLRVQNARDRVNLRCFKRLFESERRQNRRQPLGQHRFSRARRSDHQNIVSTRGGDLECTLCYLLSAHIFEVEWKVLHLVQQIGGFDLQGDRSNSTQRG